MGRKVFITSDMSIDEQLIEVAEKTPLAALIWPWILTVLDDWGRANAEPKRLKAKAFPSINTITSEIIEEALTVYNACGLIKLYKVDGKQYMAVDHDKWFKYQTHIRTEKRENDGSKIPPPPKEDVSDNSRNCAQVSAVAGNCIPSPSPSPSPIKEKDIYIRISEIITAWNEKKITTHKETDGMIKAVQKAIKTYGKDTILRAIDNYATVFHDDTYFYSHRWRLDKFLTQKNGIPDFVDDGQKWINYLDHINKKKKIVEFPNLLL